MPTFHIPASDSGSRPALPALGHENVAAVHCTAGRDNADGGQFIRICRLCERRAGYTCVNVFAAAGTGSEPQRARHSCPNLDILGLGIALATGLP